MMNRRDFGDSRCEKDVHRSPQRPNDLCSPRQKAAPLCGVQRQRVCQSARKPGGTNPPPPPNEDRRLTQILLDGLYYIILKMPVNGYQLEMDDEAPIWPQLLKRTC